jgi:peroxiredoxin Q/BCP
MLNVLRMVGSAAPDFTLPSSSGDDVTLSSFRGRDNVVLIFYPKDETPGCTKQLCTARDDRAAFAAAGAVVFGINGDSATSHAAFIAKHGLTMPLLIDRGLVVAKSYDAVIGLGPVKFANRTVVGIDRTGTIVFYQRGAPLTATIVAAFTAPATVPGSTLQ